MKDWTKFEKEKKFPCHTRETILKQEIRLDK
jgi:hypothetical protein